MPHVPGFDRPGAGRFVEIWAAFAGAVMFQYGDTEHRLQAFMHIAGKRRTRR